MIEISEMPHLAKLVPAVSVCVSSEDQKSKGVPRGAAEDHGCLHNRKMLKLFYTARGLKC